MPEYYEVVKDPMDIESISKRVESENYYMTLEMFAADFKKMFENCRLYNAVDTIYYKCANRLELFFDAKIAAGLARFKDGGEFGKHRITDPLSTIKGLKEAKWKAPDPPRYRLVHPGCGLDR